MDEHIESPGPRPGRRTFILTPAVDASAATPRQNKSRRKLIIGGSVAIPLLTTIPSQPLFAQKKTKKTKGGHMSTAFKQKNGMSLHPSITGKKSKKTKKKVENVIRNGNTVAMWQQDYPKLMQAHTVEAHAFPAKATGHRFLANPVLASVFAVPGDNVNGLSIVAPDTDMNGALNGRGNWSVSLTHNGETAHQRVDGAFFAEATAAVLNGASYGENAFGMNDKMVIDQVNGALKHLQTRALTVQRANPTWEAARILDNVTRHITGGSAADPRGETYYLAQLNTGTVV
jgi:hypothetical protein